MGDIQSNQRRSKTRTLAKITVSMGAAAFVGAALWFLLGIESSSESNPGQASVSNTQTTTLPAEIRRVSAADSASTIAPREADNAVYGSRKDLSSRISTKNWQIQPPSKPSEPKKFNDPDEELKYLESRLDGEKQLLEFRQRATEYMGKKIQRNSDFDERPKLLEKQTIVENRLIEQKQMVDTLEQRISELRSRVR